MAKEALISTWAQTYSVDDVTDAEPDEQARSSPVSYTHLTLPTKA